MAKTKGGEEAPAPSKMSIVEQALDAVGSDAGPGDLLAWIGDHYDAEISRGMVSSYASQIRKRRRGGSPAAKSGPVPVGGNGTAAAGDTVRDIATIRELLHRYGPDDLQQLVDVLSK